MVSHPYTSWSRGRDIAGPVVRAGVVCGASSADGVVVEFARSGGDDVVASVALSTSKAVDIPEGSGEGDVVTAAVDVSDAVVVSQKAASGSSVVIISSTASTRRAMCAGAILLFRALL